MLLHPITIHPLLYIVEHMRPRDRQECLALRPDDDLVEWANEIVDMPGNHFLASSNQGEPIAAGGWSDTGIKHQVNSWLVATPRIDEIGDGLHRFAVRGHKSLVLDGVRRFVTICLQGDGTEHESTARRWMKRMRYRLEGIHRGAGIRGETLITMARLEH